MEEVLENIKARRSVRAFKPDAVPQELLEKVIEAGLYAANGMGRQATTIIAVEDKETRNKLSAVNCKIGGWKEGMDPFYGAPAVLIVLSRADVPTRVYDGSCVLQNMMLAAQAVGLGSCWIHRAKEVFASAEGKALLKKWGVEGDWVGVGHCILGYPAAEPKAAAPRKADYIVKVK